MKRIMKMIYRKMLLKYLLPSLRMNPPPMALMV